LGGDSFGHCEIKRSYGCVSNYEWLKREGAVDMYKYKHCEWQ